MSAEKAYRPLNTQGLLQQVILRYMLDAQAASKNGQLAWVTSGFPVEIPEAMGITSCYPEQYGAVIGAEKVGPTLCGFAEELGYSEELCSYARSGIGSVSKPGASPIGGLPKPQALLACNNICGTVLRWYDAVSQMTGAPVFLLDTPSIEGEQGPHHISYVRKGVDRLIAFLSRTFGVSLEEQRLREVAAISSKAVDPPLDTFA